MPGFLARLSASWKKTKINSSSSNFPMEVSTGPPLPEAQPPLLTLQASSWAAFVSACPHTVHFSSCCYKLII